jgi:hypothetical protein
MKHIATTHSENAMTLFNAQCPVKSQLIMTPTENGYNMMYRVGIDPTPGTLVSLVVNEGRSLAKNGYTANTIPIELDIHATTVDIMLINAK